MKYRETFPLRYRDCDRYGRLRLSALLRILSDAATAAYQAAGGPSHADLWKADQAFVLTRLSFSFAKVPKDGDVLTVETWARLQQGYRFFRDFRVVDQTGDPVIDCGSEWVRIHPSDRSLVHPDQFVGPITHFPDQKADFPPFERLHLSPEWTEGLLRPVVFSDIDQNGHVYNAVYADMACDCLPEGWLTRPVRQFQIDFKQEALPGDRLSLRYGQVSEDTVCVAGVKEDGTVSFLCKFVFS